MTTVLPLMSALDRVDPQFSTQIAKKICTPVKLVTGHRQADVARGYVYCADDRKP